MPLRSWNWQKRSAENKRARELLDRFLHPPKRIVCTVPPASFAALIFIFASHREESAAAYPIFLLSAYSLVILLAALPALAGRLAQLKLRFWERSRLVRTISSTAFGGRYLNDQLFRSGVSIYQGMAVNFLYMLFRFMTAAGMPLSGSFPWRSTTWCCASCEHIWHSGTAAEKQRGRL